METKSSAPSMDSSSTLFSCQHLTKLRKSFHDDGYVVVDRVLDEGLLMKYREKCSKLLSNEIDASKHRHDLGSHANTGKEENITQIMWPSAYLDCPANSPLHQRLLKISQAVYGEDMAFDFDMLISKPAHSLTPTPWHQDESYWLDLPDKRTISFWVAMQDVNVDNGCMWFVPGSHKGELREHRKVKEGHHANMCNCTEDEGRPQPIAAGSCTGHHGRTLHYTRGNSSDRPRIAYIVNFRPKAMIEYERKNNYDHGLQGLDGILEMK